MGKINNALAAQLDCIGKPEGGLVVTAQLTDLGEHHMEIGMPIEMVNWKIRTVIDDRVMLVYGYKFCLLMAG